MLFQDGNLFPHLSVERNVALGRALVSHRREHAGHALFAATEELRHRDNLLRFASACDSRRRPGDVLPGAAYLVGRTIDTVTPGDIHTVAIDSDHSHATTTAAGTARPAVLAAVSQRKHGRHGRLAVSAERHTLRRDLRL